MFIEKIINGNFLAYDDNYIDHRQFKSKVFAISKSIIKSKNNSKKNIGIYLNRSVNALASINACVINGVTYIPLNPKDPLKRTLEMIEQAEIEFILTEEIHSIFFSEHNINTIFVEKLEFLQDEGEYDLRKNFSYILFTSGSSGAPKGVKVSSNALYNTLDAFNELYPTTSKDTWLYKTTYTFDVSLTEQFLWQLVGGNIAILKDGDERDPLAIINSIEKNKVTHINFVPSMFRHFLQLLSKGNLEKVRSLKYIFLAGEPVLPEMIIEFRTLNTSIKIINLYGPTEAAIYATHYDLSLWDGKKNIPIGFPLKGVEIFVLDKYYKELPTLVPGEIFIAGISLADEYIKNEQLTNSKFIINSDNQKRLYRTGDVGRVLLDGSIGFLGRKDNQIKLRGFRIELEEIENVLLKFVGIKDIVITQTSPGTTDNNLIAYYSGNNKIDEEELDLHLKSYLPAYMIPQAIIYLSEIPRSSSGKLKRNELPEFSIKNNAEIIKPINETQKKIQKIWSRVLKIEMEKISIKENFFRLGGHSLNLIEISFFLQEEFGFNIGINALYVNSTIKDLADQIEALISLKESSKSEISNELMDTITI